LASVSTPLDDKILWQAFKRGDELAFATLYQRYVRVLYAYGKKLTAENGTIEDLVQDLFIELWQSRERLADAESPKFYLFRSLRRKIHKSALTSLSSGQSWELTDEGILPVALPKEFEIIEAEGSQKQKDELESWLKNLPPRQHEVLTLRYYQNFSYAEISEILSIHEQSVRNLAQRAVLKLRQLTLPTLLIGIFLLF
jgi:RNA polymerase sigma factor (sigma-70 family)